MDLQTVAIGVSSVSMGVSALTFWLTLFRRGGLRATRPTSIYLGPDGGGGGDGEPKVCIRTLLYSTGKRGLLIENMFVRVRRGESVQNFNVWIYATGADDLVRGSGLFVGHDGVALNNHFLFPREGTHFQFLPGQYDIDLFAQLVGADSPDLLASVSLQLSEACSQAILNKKSGVFYEWGPDSQKYHSYINAWKRRPKAEDETSLLLNALAMGLPPDMKQSVEQSGASKP